MFLFVGVLWSFAFRRFCDFVRFLLSDSAEQLSWLFERIPCCLQLFCFCVAAILLRSLLCGLARFWLQRVPCRFASIMACRVCIVSTCRAVSAVAHVTPSQLLDRLLLHDGFISDCGTLTQRFLARRYPPSRQACANAGAFRKALVVFARMREDGALHS